MRVRAKFRVNSIESTDNGWREKRDPNGNVVTNEHGRPERERCEMRTIKLSPVYSPDPQHENKTFWEATPCGSIDLSTINMEAAEVFELGREYYVDFELAPDNPDQ